MTRNNDPSAWKTNFLRLIYLAQFIPTLSPVQITARYGNKPVKFVNFFYKRTHYRYIYIEFSRNVGTIRCVFDSDNRWICSFIQPNPDIHVENYNRVLCERYKYDRLEDRWTLPHVYVYDEESWGERQLLFEKGREEQNLRFTIIPR